MNLNLTVLKDYLPSELQPRLYGESQEKLICSRPFLCEADTVLTQSNTYLLRSELLPFITPVAGCSFICIGPQIPFKWQESGVPILQINNSASFTSVFNNICKIYDFFDHWDALLHTELEKQADFDIQNILKLGAELFQNQINVIDHSLTIILETVWDTAPSEKKTLHIDDTPHTLHPDMTQSIKNVCNLERRISVPYISALQNNHARSYCNNLYPLGYFTGCISISETDAYYCFKLRETNRTSCMPKEYMCATLSSFIPQVLTSTIYHQQIIGLLKIPKQEDSSRTFLSFQDMLERMNYCAGISNVFCRLDQLDECLIQADYSLQHATQILNFFSKDTLSFLLNECSSRISKELLTTEALQRVISYDARKHTEYLHTLKVYLENEMNITPAAQALFIHRSSLIKRLNKLTDLLQDSLSDPETRLYYRIWFALKEH